MRPPNALRPALSNPPNTPHKVVDICRAWAILRRSIRGRLWPFGLSPPSAHSTSSSTSAPRDPLSPVKLSAS
jgi:hypothetical protein